MPSRRSRRGRRLLPGRDRALRCARTPPSCRRGSIGSCAGPSCSRNARAGIRRRMPRASAPRRSSAGRPRPGRALLRPREGTVDEPGRRGRGHPAMLWRALGRGLSWRRSSRAPTCTCTWGDGPRSPARPWEHELRRPAFSEQRPLADRWRLDVLDGAVRRKPGIRAGGLRRAAPRRRRAARRAGPPRRPLLRRRRLPARRGAPARAPRSLTVIEPPGLRARARPAGRRGAHRADRRRSRGRRCARPRRLSRTAFCPPGGSTSPRP